MYSIVFLFLSFSALINAMEQTSATQEAEDPYDFFVSLHPGVKKQTAIQEWSLILKQVDQEKERLKKIEEQLNEIKGKITRLRSQKKTKAQGDQLEIDNQSRLQADLQTVRHSFKHLALLQEEASINIATLKNLRKFSADKLQRIDTMEIVHSLVSDAIKRGLYMTVFYALECGYNPNSFATEDDFFGTPLHLAAWHGRSNIVHLLLKYEADQKLTASIDLSNGNFLPLTAFRMANYKLDKHTNDPVKSYEYTRISELLDSASKKEIQK